MKRHLQGYATLYLRLALGLGLLSAVADRFGLWGRHSSSLVVCGNFYNFLHYTAALSPWLPVRSVPLAGLLTTLSVAAFAIALVLGPRIRPAALASGLFTFAVALAMVMALGVKAPLNYSLFAISVSFFLHATVCIYPWSLDSVLLSKAGSALSLPQTEVIRNEKKSESKTSELPGVLSWYRMLRAQYHWPLFQAVRFALWLAR